MVCSGDGAGGLGKSLLELTPRHLGIKGSGFRVWDLDVGFRIFGFGSDFRAQGSGLRVKG